MDDQGHGVMPDASPHIRNPHFDSFPFFFQGGSSGVLLTHGLSATPVEVRLVAEYLHKQGYTVSGPRLPGHGTSVKDLNRCTWRDWVDHVTVAYEELTSRCKRVFVGGESTGGLLALYLGSARQEITGLIAYAPALRASRRLMYLTPLLKYFVKAVEKKRAGYDPDSIVNQRWQGYNVDAVPALAQLLALQRQVKRRLSKITQPLLVLQGRLDTTLDIHGAQQVVDRVNSADKELVWLNQSSHCLALDVEWEKAAEITLAFIQRIEKKVEC